MRHHRYPLSHLQVKVSLLDFEHQKDNLEQEIIQKEIMILI